MTRPRTRAAVTPLGVSQSAQFGFKVRVFVRHFELRVGTRSEGIFTLCQLLGWGNKFDLIEYLTASNRS